MRTRRYRRAAGRRWQEPGAGDHAARSPRVRDTLFLAYRDVQRAVRDERWKLIVYPKINKLQLFDLHDDPYEMQDLSADPAQSDASRNDAGRCSAGSRKWVTSGSSCEWRPVSRPTFVPPTGDRKRTVGRNAAYIATLFAVPTRIGPNQPPTAAPAYGSRHAPEPAAGVVRADVQHQCAVLDA